VSSSGDGLTRFINGDTSGDGIPIVNVANPVNWGKLGKTITTSIIATVVVGVTNVVAAITEQWVAILGGFEAFIEGSRETHTGVSYEYTPGLIDVTLGAAVSGYSEAFSYSSAQFGVLALPINFGIVLASVYVLSVGLQAAASRLFGGG